MSLLSQTARLYANIVIVINVITPPKVLKNATKQENKIQESRSKNEQSSKANKWYRLIIQVHNTQYTVCSMELL